MPRRTLRLRHDGSPYYAGLQTGAVEIWQRTGDILIIKEHGHKYWSGLYSPPSYAPAVFVVFRVIREVGHGDGANRNDMEMELEGLVEFPIRREIAHG